MTMTPGSGQQAPAPAPESGAAPQQAQAGQDPQAAAPAQPAAPPPPHHKVRRTRVGGVWVALALFALVLLVLLIFILENSHTIVISFFGAKGHLPLGVALLLAAVLGVLLVVVPGTARIMQLRRTARRHRKQDIKAAAPGQPPADQPPADPAQAQGAPPA